MDVFDQIGHAPCSLCYSDRTTTASSSPNLRSDLQSEGGPSKKSAALVETEYRIKHYKALLRIAADKLEEAVRSANNASARMTSSDARAADALVKVAAAEDAYQRAESQRSRTEQELERRRSMLEESESELRRTRRDVSRLEMENQTLRRLLENSKESEEYHVHTLRDLQARQEGEQESHIVDLKRNFIEGREEGWNDGYWHGFDEGFEKGRKEGYREGRKKGKREEREKAMAAFDRILDDDLRDERTRQWTESVHD
ncbi:hypothetical protein M378DRAFT_10273 [Amanita muscaria Koide BX008]|uniref:Uncharacterized protein n=1 Tax=Amanita muscaria (strain Koide BX008) TaxID=946122 RepID=A0A0C2XBS1_AMAMK|nr:hypothetical protein M378DRAFT_10273 [Amanita muscaria Koide BX008]